MSNKKLIIVVGKDGRPSMKGVYSKMLNESYLFVRRRLQSATGQINEYWRQYKDHNVDKFEKLKEVNLGANIIVRWGNTIPLNLQGCITYNKSENISKASNKKLSREIFEENGLNCPKLIKSQADIVNYPIIARPSKHAKGKNFIILNTLQEYINHSSNINHKDWYYSEFVDKKQEFRLHIAHGRILNYLEKPRPTDNQIAWNRALNEDPFVNVKWSDYNSDICSLAIKAINILGLDFGAVDIMLTEDNKACLLEVNTAGTLVSSEYSMTRYAKYFDWLCKTDKRREHHEFKEFKKASNYAWHEYHFEDREPNKEQ